MAVLVSNPGLLNPLKKNTCNTVGQDVQYILVIQTSIIQILVSQKLVIFHEFHYDLQDGGLLVMQYAFQPPVCYLFLPTNKVFNSSANARSTERVYMVLLTLVFTRIISVI